MDKKARILELLKKEELGVVSTTNSENKPQAAVVAVTETGNLEIIFGTFNTSRKYRNILENSHVAIVIGWDDWKTVQYEGIARELSRQELESAKKLHLVKHPKSRDYVNHPDERFFKVIPRWIRYTDYNVEPEEIFEVNFQESRKPGLFKGKIFVSDDFDDEDEEINKLFYGEDE